MLIITEFVSQRAFGLFCQFHCCKSITERGSQYRLLCLGISGNRRHVHHLGESCSWPSHHLISYMVWIYQHKCLGISPFFLDVPSRHFRISLNISLNSSSKETVYCPYLFFPPDFPPRSNYKVNCYGPLFLTTRHHCLLESYTLKIPGESIKSCLIQKTI